MHETFATIHVAGAIGAYLSAFLLFTQKVGSKNHRYVGIGYAVSMLTLALTGLGIYNFGHPSIFHVFTVITLWSVGQGWFAIARYRKNRDKQHLMDHYFNMAYSFMGLNLAAIAQSMRLFSFSSAMEYFTILGVVYFAAIVLANRLIQKVFFRRFSHWFQAKAAE